MQVVFYPKADQFTKLVRSAFYDLGVVDVTGIGDIKDFDSQMKRVSNDTPLKTIGLLFKDINGTETRKLPRHLQCILMPGRLSLDIHVAFGENLLAQTPGPVRESRFAEMHTILPIMSKLQSAHLELYAKENKLTLTDVGKVELHRFPYPSHIEETDVRSYALVLSRFCIGMLVPFAIFVARLTEERSSGMKEMLRIVGLNDWVYWVSHYLSAFFMHLITVTLMMLFLCAKHNSEGRAFIQYSDPLLLFCILMWFCSSCMLHAMLLSLFFANGE